MNRPFAFFTLSGRNRYSMMIPAVVLVSLLFARALSLPLSTQEFTTAGTQASNEFTNPHATTGQKSQTGGVPQITTGTNEGSFVETSATKSGVEGIPTAVAQNSGQSENGNNSESGQGAEPAIIRGQSAVGIQYSGVETTSEVEQTGVEVFSASHEYSRPFVPKEENLPTNVDKKQPYQSDNPSLLPIQPMAAVPVNQVGEFLGPVVLPPEAVTAERVIIMAIKPIQQRNFQDVSTTPEKQIPHQQVNEGEQIQSNAAKFGQPVEKVEFQRGGQAQTPVQVPFVKEQVVHNTGAVLQTAEPVPNYVPAVEPGSQTYSVQPVQPVVGDNVQKQVPPQSTVYTPGHTQFVEFTLPQQQAYSVPQKQGVFQQPGYDTIPHQSQTLYLQQGHPIVGDGPQSQLSDPAGQFVQQRILHPNHQQQSPERKTPQRDPVPVQDQPLTQQVYNVQPESQQSYVPLGAQPVQQKLSIGQSGYQESYTPVQPLSLDQTQTAYQSQGEEVPSRQSFQSALYVQPQESIPQQQVSNVQPLAGVPTEIQLPVQSVQSEISQYVPQQVHKTAEKQLNRVVGAQPPQVGNDDEPIYTFGDRVHQNPTVQQSNPLQQTPCQQCHQFETMC